MIETIINEPLALPSNTSPITFDETDIRTRCATCNCNGWLDYSNGTVGEVSGMFPNNTLLITMNWHIVCSKNGIIYDTFDCRNREAEYVWIVK